MGGEGTKLYKDARAHAACLITDALNESLI